MGSRHNGGTFRMFVKLNENVTFHLTTCDRTCNLDGNQGWLVEGV